MGTLARDGLTIKWPKPCPEAATGGVLQYSQESTGVGVSFYSSDSSTGVFL